MERKRLWETHTERQKEPEKSRGQKQTNTGQQKERKRSRQEERVGRWGGTGEGRRWGRRREGRKEKEKPREKWEGKKGREGRKNAGWGAKRRPNKEPEPKGEQRLESSLAGSPKEEETWSRPAWQLREESPWALRLPNRKVRQTGKSHSLGPLSLSQQQGGTCSSALLKTSWRPRTWRKGAPSLCCALPPPPKKRERTVGRTGRGAGKGRSVA